MIQTQLNQHNSLTLKSYAKKDYPADFKNER